MQGAGGRLERIIDSLTAATALLAPLFAQARAERLVVAHLDRNSGLLGLRIRYAPLSQAIDVPLREIVGDALDLGSAALIVAHNHPSGDANPSGADIEATRRLLQATRPLGVTLRDHLIFGGSNVVSFRQRGLL